MAADAGIRVTTIDTKESDNEKTNRRAGELLFVATKGTNIIIMTKVPLKHNGTRNGKEEELLGPYYGGTAPVQSENLESTIWQLRLLAWRKTFILR
ncbi:MAG: hypothetical protein ACLR2D_06410 [Anaerobutyricum hallii]